MGKGRGQGTLFAGLTFRPMTPRQAMEGIAVAIVVVEGSVGAPRGRHEERVQLLRALSRDDPSGHSSMAP